MATYKPLIIKSEFRTFCKLGANVGKDFEIDSYIRDMQDLEFRNGIDTDFYNDCISDTTSRPELQTFINDYIKPYLICGAYEKFLLWHGNNVSQFGIRNNNEDTSTEISDKAKGELMRDVQRKTNAYLGLMKKELCNVNYKFDNVTYNFQDDNKRDLKRNIGIFQVGRKK